MMRRSALFALLCTTSLLAPALAQSTTALKKSIQANYLSINDLAQRGQLRVQMRRCPNVGPEFSLMSDRAGKVVRYAVSHGGEDSAFTVQHDYDSARRLTFVLVTYATVRGERAEWRFYFAPSGRVVDMVRSGSTGMLPERILWEYITRDPMLDWTTKWCP